MKEEQIILNVQDKPKTLTCRFRNKQNLIISSVILVIGIGDATIKFENLDLHGMA